MNTKLDNEEFKITYLITRNALAHAAQSLSRLLKDEVKLLKLDLREDRQGLPTVSDHLGKTDCFLLRTDIFGEFRAQSNLIISEEEAHKIWKITQPPNISLQDEMREAILLELDNILTASVISEMVNILRLEAFGGIPKLEKTNPHKIMEELFKEDNIYNYYFFLNTVMVCKNTQISPSFIWLFKEELIDTIRNVIKNPESYPGLSKIGTHFPNHHSQYE
ncbi:MAG: hypothetical protein NW226_16190 [Microscillaceae bacterium]|nr:hypothetical protein [Microscillaceae bacterium]